MEVDVQVQGKAAFAKVLSHSINPDGHELLTFQLKYPRIIHSEFMTHREKSRSASSSRAIPVDRMLAEVRCDPAMPVSWGKNQSGMQAGEEISTEVALPDHLEASFARYLKYEIGAKYRIEQTTRVTYMPPESFWRFSAWVAAGLSNAYSDAGYHKQIANRLTEPFQYISVVTTSTGAELKHFYGLRDHHMADPTIEDLAKAMRAAQALSIPRPLNWGEWHLPYATEDLDAYTQIGKVMVSTARCARVSYNRHDGEPASVNADFDLHNRLVKSEPQHASPAEHPAIALRGRYANFEGFCSYRWQLEHGVFFNQVNGVNHE